MKTTRWTSIVSLLTASILILFMAGPVSAVPTYFTDRASFDAATGGGLNFESFEGTFTDNIPLINFPGFSVEETGGTNLLRQTWVEPDLDPMVTHGDYALYYDDNGLSIGTFFNFTNPVTAFGLDVTATLIDSDVTIGGDVAGVLNLTLGISQFWGVIDYGGLNSISFDASGGPLLGFDAVSYGVVASVPEPSTLLLLGTGLIGLAGFRRKFRS